jgi:peptidoglycan hydrolase CwlO-like protein
MKITQLDDQMKDYQAKKRNTEHELEQFRSAIQRLKKDVAQAR